jgi:ATP-dependent Clp protease ATP-binding subunit ClpA
MSHRTAPGYARQVTEPVPTPRYQRVLRASVESARGMSHSYVGVEHLFLAIIRDRDAVPAQVLARLVDLDAVEAALLDLMNSESYNTATTSNVIGSGES